MRQRAFVFQLLGKNDAEQNPGSTNLSAASSVGHAHSHPSG
jgi:hypothetical protein